MLGVKFTKVPSVVVNVFTGSTHELSPLKKLVAEGVPVAESKACRFILLFAPVVSVRVINVLSNGVIPAIPALSMIILLAVLFVSDIPVPAVIATVPASAPVPSANCIVEPLP